MGCRDEEEEEGGGGDDDGDDDDDDDGDGDDDDDDDDDDDGDDGGEVARYKRWSDTDWPGPGQGTAQDMSGWGEMGCHDDEEVDGDDDEEEEEEEEDGGDDNEEEGERVTVWHWEVGRWEDHYPAADTCRKRAVQGKTLDLLRDKMEWGMMVMVTS